MIKKINKPKARVDLEKENIDNRNELFSFVPIPTIFINPQGAILEANPAFEKFTNKDLYKITESSVEFFFESKEIKKIIKETFQKGSVKEREIYFSAEKDKLIPVSVFSQAKFSDKKQAVGCFLSILDLGEIRELEEKLDESKKILEIRVEARIRELKEITGSLEKKVKERTEELGNKLEELELMNKLMVGRELKMIELKEQLREAEEEILKLKK